MHPLGEELARRLGSLFPGRGTASAVALADEARAQEMGGGRTSTAHPWACAGGRAVSDTPPAREAPPEAWRTRLTNNRKCVSRYGCPAGLRDLRVCPPGHAAPRRLFSLRPSPFRSGNYARGPHPQQGGPLVSPVFPRRYRHTLQTRNVRGRSFTESASTHPHFACVSIFGDVCEASRRALGAACRFSPPPEAAPSGALF